MLNLPEELFLLAINDEKGVVHPSAAMNLKYGLAGAVLADLALQNRLGIDENKRIIVLNAQMSGDEILDEVLARIAGESKAHKPAHWVATLVNQTKRLEGRLAGSLETMGILHKEGKRLLWIIPYEVYPQQDASAKYWIKQRLRSTVLAHAEADPRTIALLALLRACGMLDLVFTKDERKAARRIIERMTSEDVFAQGVMETLEAIESAAMIAAIAAATTT